MGVDDLARRTVLRFCGLASLLGTAGAAGCRKARGRFVVGFSQMANIGAWRLAETNSLRREAERRSPEYDLIVTDAQDSTAKQIGDVEDLVARRVEALLVAPRDYDGLEPALEAAGRARIPVILIDREAAGVPGRDYVTFLGSDFIAQGRRAAAWLTSARGGAAAIIELSGSPGSSVARDRARGFREGLAGHPGMRILGTQTAEFTRATALRVMENILQGRGREVTAVYAHNDEMGLGAIEALRTAGRRPGKDVTVVSIDGQRLALEAILRGELGATVESNPRFGPLAFATLDKLRAGQPVASRMILEDRLFDARNAAQFVAEAY
jgi:ABC-type sugar transport system substrate-binding protein